VLLSSLPGLFKALIVLAVRKSASAHFEVAIMSRIIVVIVCLSLGALVALSITSFRPACSPTFIEGQGVISGGSGFKAR
jgi:hypothetical protein